MPTWMPFQGPRSDTLAGVVTPSQRIAELKKLAEASASAAPSEKARISQQLSDSIKSEKDPLIRLEIIRTIGKYPSPEADAILKAALSDSDANVRRIACGAWGKRGDAEAVKLLSETLRSDVEADVRLAAAEALGATKNNKEAVTGIGRGVERFRSGHAISGRVVAQTDDRQRFWRRCEPLASVCPRRQASAGTFLGRADVSLVLVGKQDLFGQFSSYLLKTMTALPLPQDAKSFTIGGRSGRALPTAHLRSSLGSAAVLVGRKQRNSTRGPQTNAADTSHRPV